MTGMEFLVRGGVWLLPILVASLIGVAVFVERMLYIRVSTILGSPEQLKRLQTALGSGDREDIDAAITAMSTPLGHTLQRGLESDAASEMRESMEAAGRAERYLMKRRTGAVSAMAAISPLLGLLGTVVGMISMFQGVVANAQAASSAPDIGVLADGIWEALLTTAAGLIVAIPLFVGHRALLGRINDMTHQMESMARQLVDRIGRVRGEEGEVAS